MTGFVTWLGNRIVGKDYRKSFVVNPGVCGRGWFITPYGEMNACNKISGHAGSCGFAQPFAISNKPVSRTWNTATYQIQWIDS